MCLEKLSRYASGNARDLYVRGKTASLSKAISHGLWAFLRTYVLRRGFLDGRHGFMLAVYNAESTTTNTSNSWPCTKKKAHLPPPAPSLTLQQSSRQLSSLPCPILRPTQRPPILRRPLFRPAGIAGLLHSWQRVPVDPCGRRFHCVGAGGGRAGGRPLGHRAAPLCGFSPRATCAGLLGLSCVWLLASVVVALCSPARFHKVLPGQSLALRTGVGLCWRWLSAGRPMRAGCCGAFRWPQSRPRCLHAVVRGVLGACNGGSRAGPTARSTSATWRRWCACCCSSPGLMGRNLRWRGSGAFLL